MTQDSTKKTYKEFAASIKEKYPQYADIDDKELAEKIIGKYPQYADIVSFDDLEESAGKPVEESAPLKKKDEPISTSTSESLESDSGSGQEKTPVAFPDNGQGSIMFREPEKAPEEQSMSLRPKVIVPGFDDKFMTGFRPGMATEEAYSTGVKPTPVQETKESDASEGDVSQYVPAGGMLFDFKKAYTSIPMDQLEQMSPEEVNLAVAKNLHDQAIANGWSEDQIKKAEYELYQKHGIDIDITMDGISNSEVGIISSGLKSIGIGSGKFMRGANAVVYGALGEIVSTVGGDEARQMVRDFAGLNKETDVLGRRIKELESQRRNATKGVVESLADQNYEAALTSIFNSTGESLVLSVVGGVSGSMATLGTISAGMEYMEVKDEEFFQNMNNVEKLGYLTVMGGAEAIGEMAGARVLNRIIKDISTNAGKKGARELFKGMLVAYGKNIPEEAYGEGVTAFIQGIEGKVARGEDVNVRNLFLEVAEGSIMGAGSAMLMTSGGNVISGGVNSAAALGNRLNLSFGDNKANVSKMRDAIMEAYENNLPEGIVASMMGEYMKANQSAIEKAKGFRELASKMTDEERNMVTYLLMENERSLEAASKTTNVEMAERLRQSAENSMKAITSVMTDVKERESKKTEEISRKKAEISGNSKASVEKVAALDNEAEDGATLNLDGTTYDGGGLVVPVASMNTTQEEITPEMISDFIEEKVPGVDADNVKVGLYKFPNSNQVSIDLNIITDQANKEAAIEFGKAADQESLFDMDTFENIKTGGTGQNPVSYTPEQINQIAKDLSEGKVPQINTEQSEQIEQTESKPAAGNRLFNKPVEAVKAIADKYVERVFGSQRSQFQGVEKVDKERAKRISDAFDQMEDNPNAPVVREAYQKMAEETLEQYRDFVAAGYTVEMNNDEPYANAQEMMDDVRDNKRMKIFSTEEGFGDDPITDEQRANNPLLAKTEFTDVNGKPMLVNDVFRAVHDFFGHAELGNGFGPVGEENAWNVHARMYSPLARRAMTTETRGQNSWVNFSGVNDEAFALRDKARQLRKEGKEEEAAELVNQVYEMMRFADQKIGLLPEEFSTPDDVQENEAFTDNEQADNVNTQEQPVDSELDQEVSDLEKLMNEGSDEIELKSELKTSTLNDLETQAIVDEMNSSGNAMVDASIEAPSSGNPVNVQSLSNRAGKKVNEVSIDDIDGAPVVFTISDQLTGGQVVNPETGNVIGDLKGGIMYNYLTAGRAWANTTFKEAQSLIEKAKLAYQNNREALESWWEKNPEFINHVPLVVVKMAEKSILSNEAVMRVLLDNVSGYSSARQKAALTALKGKLRGVAKTSGKKGVDSRKALDTIISKGVLELSDIFKPEFYNSISISQRAAIMDAVLIGSPTKPGMESKSLGVPGPGSVARALAGVSMTKSLKKGELSARKQADLDRAKARLSATSVTDLLTDQDIANVAPRSILSINAVDISENGGVVDGQHPNYPHAVKGKAFGILSNPVSVSDVFPSVYANAVRFIKSSILKGKKESTSNILTFGVPVQSGMPNIEFIGAIADSNPTNASRLMAWLNRSFPGTVVSTTKEDFNRVMSREDVSKHVKSGTVVYGVTVDGDVYINPDVHNSESELFDTGIHEFGHIWANYIEANNKPLFQKGVTLVKKTSEYQKWYNKYRKNGMTESAASAKAVKETMAVLIGNKGATITDAAVKSKWGNFLAAAWDYIRSAFKMSSDLTADEVQNMRLDQFIGTALADIFSGDAISNAVDSSVELKNPEVFFSSSDSLISTIDIGRANGFSDSAIKQFLLKQGFKASEINEALEVPLTLSSNVPSVFGDIEGGMAEGIQLYNRVMSKLQAYAKRKVTTGVKADKKGVKTPRKRTAQEIRQKGQEILLSELDSIEASEMVKLQIQNAFDKSLGITKNKKVSEDMKAIREVVRQQKRGAKRLADIKSKVRVFIRKTLPLGDYNKAQVLDLIKLVNEATNENIEAIFDQVIDQVVRQNVKTTLGKISAIRKTKLSSLQNGVRKGKVPAADKTFFEALFLQMGTAKTNFVDLSLMVAAQDKKIAELESKENLSEDELNQYAAMLMARDFNNALLMEDTDSRKLEALDDFYNNIANQMATARQVIKLRAIERRRKYERLKAMAVKDIAGVDIDYRDEASVSAAREAIDRKQNLKDNTSRFATIIRHMITDPVKKFISKHEGIEGLIDSMSRSMGEMFGGPLQEFVTDQIDKASSAFKGGRMIATRLIDTKAQEIFGKKYRQVMRKNAIANEFFYTDVEEGMYLEKQLEKAKKARDKKAERQITNKLKEVKKQVSQNEIYYLYNQYKDEANHPGFETKFGPKYDQVLQYMFSKMTPEVREWADWQVDEFFPTVYDRYNATYREINQTDLPRNKKYAGRVVREGVKQEEETLLNANNPFVVSVGARSVKERTRNRLSIATKDGDKMLSSYIDEMEFFNAYAQPMNDILKVFRDKDVKAAVKATSGDGVYEVFETMIERIIDRGRSMAMESEILDYITGTFVKSKLGLNPTVFLKQLTSSIAFADYIGYRNWITYGAKSLKSGIAGYNSEWKELYANSNLLQDRYEDSDISRVLENYSKDRRVKIGKEGKLDNAAEKFSDVLMYLVKQGDKGGVMGSIPNYMYYKDQFMQKNPNAAPQAAIDYAVAKVERQIGSTQQSADKHNKDFFQTGTAVTRSLNMFLSSPKALFRKEIIAARNLYRKMRGRDSKGTIGDNLRTLMTYHVAIPMLFQYIALGLPGILRDWEDDDNEEMGWAALYGNINALFILSDAALAIRDIMMDKPWAADMNTLPIFQTMGDIAKNLQRFLSAAEDDTKEKYLTKTIISASEGATGLPINNIKKFAGNLEKVAEGDVDDFGEALLRLFNYSEYAIQGGSPNKKELSAYEENLKETNPELFKALQERK